MCWQLTLIFSAFYRLFLEITSFHTADFPKSANKDTLLVVSPINVIKTINVIPTINVIKINHKCNTNHKCNNF